MNFCLTKLLDTTNWQRNPKARKLLKFVYTKLSSNDRKEVHFRAFCNVIAWYIYIYIYCNTILIFLFFRRRAKFRKSERREREKEAPSCCFIFPASRASSWKTRGWQQHFPTITIIHERLHYPFAASGFYSLFMDKLIISVQVSIWKILPSRASQSSLSLS